MKTNQYGLPEAWGSITTDKQAATYRKKTEKLARVDGYEITWTNNPYKVTEDDAVLSQKWFKQLMS